jgi:hypothetical protein
MLIDKLDRSIFASGVACVAGAEKESWQAFILDRFELNMLNVERSRTDIFRSIVLFLVDRVHWTIIILSYG